MLEVMVAFAIAALAMTALMQGALGGLRATQAAAHTQEALSLARSRLAAVSLNPRAGEQSGEDGAGFAWHVLIRPQAVSGAQDNDGPHLILYDIVVEVSWAMDGGARRVRLDTQRLGAAPAS